MATMKTFVLILALLRISEPKIEAIKADFEPSDLKMFMGTRRKVSITCCSNDQYPEKQRNFLVNLTSAVPPTLKVQDLESSLDEEPKSGISFEVANKQKTTFLVYADYIGQADLVVDVRERDLPKPQKTFRYTVSVKRKVRLVDSLFEGVITGIAVIISFALGCLTNLHYLKEYWKTEVRASIVTFGTQFFILPPLMYGVAKLAKLESSAMVGLMVSVTIPGGGIGYLLASVMGSDELLNVNLNAMATVLSILFMPFWTFLLGQIILISEPEWTLIPIHMLELWLLIVTSPYILGMITHHWALKVSEAILNWFIKPILLLFMILYITLGIYINMYAFKNVEPVFITSLCLPLSGFCLSIGIGMVAGLPKPKLKAVVCQCSTFKSFVAIAVLRFALDQPTADLASILPIWIVFMSFTPFVAAKFSYRFIKAIQHWWKKQKQKSWKEQMAYGIDEMSKVVGLPIVSVATEMTLRNKESQTSQRDSVVQEDGQVVVSPESQDMDDERNTLFY